MGTEIAQPGVAMRKIADNPAQTSLPEAQKIAQAAFQAPAASHPAAWSIPAVNNKRLGIGLIAAGMAGLILLVFAAFRKSE